MPRERLFFILPPGSDRNESVSSNPAQLVNAKRLNVGVTIDQRAPPSQFKLQPASGIVGHLRRYNLARSNSSRAQPQDSVNPEPPWP
jgi:hypothetical protein